MKKIILSLIILLIAPFVSAVVGNSFWIDLNGNEIQGDTLTINNGEEPDFHIYMFSNTPYDIYVYIIDSASRNNVHTYLLTEDYSDRTFVHDYKIGSNFYQPGRNYEIYIIGDPGYRNALYSKILYLNVRQEINDAPQVNVISPNGGEVLSGISQIRWTADDPEDDELTIDIDYSSNNGQSWSILFNSIANDDSEQFDTRDLANGNQYLIRVTADDGTNRASDTSNNVFSIRNNHDPTIRLISPSNNANNIPLNIELIWEGFDLDDDALTYDVYLNNQLIANDIENQEHQLNNLNYNTIYSWRIIANDGALEVRSAIWSFRTVPRDDNNPPSIPSNPYPENNAENIPTELTLRWTGGDPDNDIVAYDVYLNGRIVCNDAIQSFCYIEDLNYNTRYSWKVIASDGQLTAESPLWRFKTQEIRGLYPPIIEITSPREDEVIRGYYNIQWDASDADGNIVSTKIYYKRLSNIPLIKGIINELFGNYRLLVQLQGNPENYNWNTKDARNGAYSIKIIVTDDDNLNGEYIIEQFQIRNFIPRENNAPRITSEPMIKAVLNNAYFYDVNAVDVDNDQITYILERAPEGMTINPITGIIRWIPRNTGQFMITVKAEDEHGSYDTQTFLITVSDEEKVEIRDIHKISVSNVIVDYDNEYINVYVKTDNKGNQNERMQLRAVNMNTGEASYDSFLLENGDGYWRIINLPRPKFNGIYTIAVFGSSNDLKNVLYREIVI